ncbi:pseudouridine synthase, partial [Phycomyces nitens]
YNAMSKDQLVKRVLALETQLTQPSPDTSLYRPQKRKPERPFDMNKYGQRRVAFKVAYLGWNYLGFASQNDPISTPTVEDEIFKAFRAARLMHPTPEQAQFSRCGRTDRGVSGLGQVISLNVRSTLANGKEIPYLETVNRLLPKDIRLLAWSPVSDAFNARFDCRSRTYKYFFPKHTLDIKRMKEAALYFVGTHDFRNFCKLDPSKNITNYHRTIVSLDIRPVHGLDTSGVGLNTDFYEVKLKGTAFLWHQVRCMMSILFLAGQGLESPEIVKQLLDVETIDARPDYPMANDLPLVLYDCEFDNIDWIYASDNHTAPSAVPTPLRTYNHIREQWSEQMTRGLMYQTFMSSMTGMPVTKRDTSITSLEEYMESDEAEDRQSAVAVVLGGGKEIRTSRYRPLVSRPRADTDAVKKKKYKIRLQKK